MINIVSPILVRINYVLIKTTKTEFFKLDELERSLSEGRNCRQMADNEIIRISRAFALAKKDQETVPPCEFKIGGMWKDLIDESFGDLAQSFFDGDIEKAKMILSNFGIDKCSLGISMCGTLPKNREQMLELLNTYNNSCNRWSKISENIPLKLSSYPIDIGRMPGICVGDGVLPVAIYRQSYYAAKIAELAKKTDDREMVLELGAGYGGCPYSLFNDYGFFGTYIDIDIPEILSIATYFLMQCFPEKKFLLYGEQKNLDAQSLRNYDFVMMPNFMIRSMPSESIDVVFNAHSLVEMDFSAIDAYIKEFYRISKKYLLHFNHEFNRVYGYASSGRVKRQAVMRSYRGFDGSLYKLIYVIPEVLQNCGGVWEGRGYYEYMLQKVLRSSRDVAP
jgi:hypothetical protein